MKRKIVFYSEISYIVGILVLAFGTAYMEKADFGMSMIVAPAYLIHLKVSQFLPFFSFGMAVYVFQAVFLCLLSLVMHKTKFSYLLSFVTAFVYGIVLDGVMTLVSFIPFSGVVLQIVFYVIGLIACSIGVSFLFNTYNSFLSEVLSFSVAEEYNYVKKICSCYCCWR